MGTLYLISGILGDNNDVSRNMLDTVQKCHLLFVEEIKVFNNFLRDNDITFDGTLIEMTFDNKRYYPIISKLLGNNASVGLFESSGTPCFVDPGADIVNHIYEIKKTLDIQIIHIPGGSALTAAISLCGFQINSFIFGGFFSSESFESMQVNNLVHVFFLRHGDVFNASNIIGTNSENIPGEVFIGINMSKRGVVFMNTCFRGNSSESIVYLEEIYKKFRKENHIPDIVLVFNK